MPTSGHHATSDAAPGPPDVVHLGPSLELTLWRVELTSGGTPSPAHGSYSLRWTDPVPADREGPVLTATVGHDDGVMLSFRSNEPAAVSVSIDGRNALTGAPTDEGLSADPQSYVVVPIQRVLLGAAAATSPAEQLRGPSGDEPVVVRVVVRRLLGAAYRRWWVDGDGDQRANRFGPITDVLGGGSADPTPGRVDQRIEPDPFGIDAWDPSPVCIAELRLVAPSSIT